MKIKITFKFKIKAKFKIIAKFKFKILEKTLDLGPSRVITSGWKVKNCTG